VHSRFSRFLRLSALLCVVVLILAVNAHAMMNAALELARFAAGVVGGTPPPPYIDPSKTTTNALGGVGRTQGWTVTVSGGAAVDVLADANIPADIKADVEAPSTTSFTRFLTLMRVPTSTATSVSVVCGRLGPNIDTTPDTLGCPELQDSDASTGGCFLFADSQYCQETLRPIVSCSSYSACHTPLWVKGSTAVAQQVHVSIAW